MCGLILAPSEYATKLPNALRAMKHRGPDAMEVYQNTDWALGHVRLAIQNVGPSGDQPFSIGNGGFAAFVGELFEHRDLNEISYLQRLFRSQDFDRLHDIDGFWAMAHVFDKEAQVLTDHLGIKPLYYWAEHNIVSSEILPMFELEPAPPIDRLYMAEIHETGVPSFIWRTPWKGITQIPPRTLLTLSRDEPSSSRVYWDWNKVDKDPNLLRLLRQAVGNRVRLSDVPVCMLLSGGLDSSAVYYLAKEFQVDLKPFSIENGETEFLPDDPELTFLKAPRPRLIEAVGAMQAPLDLGSLLPQFALARAVHKKGYSVCVTGDGADEAFGGYRRSLGEDTQDYDLNFELPAWHLPRLDRIHMHFSTEIRSPFLSPRIIRHALALPRHERTGKAALKTALKDIVPKRIIDREKKPLKTDRVRNHGPSHRKALIGVFHELFN